MVCVQAKNETVSIPPVSAKLAHEFQWQTSPFSWLYLCLLFIFYVAAGGGGKQRIGKKGRQMSWGAVSIGRSR